MLLRELPGILSTIRSPCLRLRISASFEVALRAEQAAGTTSEHVIRLAALFPRIDPLRG